MAQKYYVLKNDAMKFAIRRHSLLQSEIGEGIIEQETIDALDTVSKNIALVKSEFKCSKCKSQDKRLSFHHLILSCYKEIMPIKIYLMIRHNWKTIVILCKDCHKSYHGKNNKGEDIYYISEQRIEAVKRDFFDEKG